MRETLDAALKVSVDGNDLRKALREQGYELDANPVHKYAALRRIGSKKAVQLFRLEEDCNLSALRERLEENRQRYAYDLNYQWYKPIPIQRPQTKRRRMDAISRQAQLICREKLDTGEDVQTFIDERKSELERLQTARQKCYNRLHRCKDGVEIAAIKIERDRLKENLKREQEMQAQRMGRTKDRHKERSAAR